MRESTGSVYLHNQRRFHDQKAVMNIKSTTADVAPIRMVGFAGVAVIFLALFLPIATVPIMGATNLLSSPLSFWCFSIYIAVALGAYAVRNAVRGLIAIAGAITLTLTTVYVATFEFSINQAAKALELQLKGNPFAGIARLATSSIHLEWGIGILALGGIILLYDAFAGSTPYLVGKSIADSIRLHPRKSKVFAAASVILVVTLACVKLFSIYTNYENISQLQKLSVRSFSRSIDVSDPQSGRYNDQITITLNMQNSSAKAISGYKGVIKFSDSLGDEIDSIRVSSEGLENRARAGSKFTYVGSIDVNRFDTKSSALKDSPIDQINASWTTDKILFADGSKISRKE